MGSFFQIAIDGPVAAGKSSVARELAKKLDFVYVDTGAMYRAVTLKALDNGIAIGNEDELVQLVRGMEIDVRAPFSDEKDGRLSTVLMDGRDVSWEIRTPRVSEAVATVAGLPRVREVLVEKQRKIALLRKVVMEGRDITYVVLPEADLKIYLTANEKVRIERYFQMLSAKDSKITRLEARQILKDRDELDITREASPLRIVKDAWVLDTSEMNIEEVVQIIAEKVGGLS
ncbi:MAG: Cytidylate kinase [Microgenomates group bacterium GW2011_GWF2_47_9]|nr:MAG: Cytidylate kinase [Microgenomates group bacterium GW2011_GWF2_47_9]